MAIINFDCVEWDKLHPETDFSLIPENTEIDGVIETMEERQTLNGGMGFRVTYKLSNNRKIFDFINFVCPTNQQAEIIGKSFLRSIAKALSMQSVPDTNALLNKPLTLVIGIKKGGTQYRKQDGTIGVRDDSNFVKRVKRSSSSLYHPLPPQQPTPPQPMQQMIPQQAPSQQAWNPAPNFQQSAGAPPWASAPMAQPMQQASPDDDLPF